METLTTKYAPAERQGKEIINQQSKTVESNTIVVSILSALSVVAAILNKERQIIFANKPLMEMLGITDINEVCGARPGEILNCVNSGLEPGGCGTSEHCRYCGAVNSIIESQITNQKVTKECRITSKVNDSIKNYDFSVTSTPFKVDGEDFTILSIADIGEEKRKRALERIFFHDVINTAGGLNGFVDYLRECEDIEEIRTSLDDISKISARLLEEIISQRDLASAENNELGVIPAPIDTKEFIEDIQSQIIYHPVSEGKIIIIDKNSEYTPLISDKRLLGRVVTNMLKNAIEATEKGGTVTFGTTLIENGLKIWVNNPSVMPREIELQVFQRSFSTKGANRGLGTYSIKLIGEKYLGGKVTFTTNKETGTTFNIEIPKILK